MKQESTTSYKQIAKSTGIFGGSQVLVILIGIVRTKVLAVLLGTAGVGLVGMFQSIIDLMRSVTSLGLGVSSVREIAEADKTQDRKKMAESMTVLRRWIWWTSILGMLLTIAFSAPLSNYVFGDKSKIWPICLLSFCVLTGTISSGQVAILQGLRQIRKMAKATFYGALAGSLVAVALYSLLGINGVVPAMIAISLIGMFLSAWYAHGLKVEKATMTAWEIFQKGGNMVKLGVYTVLAGLLSTLTLFLLKSFILKTGDVETVGLLQSVWSITNMYVGAILTSMAADFFPRLCGMNDQPEDMVRFTNEQTHFVLLVSAPMMVGMLLIASPVLSILYSSKFLMAAGLLRWQIMGAFLKVLVWPIGFILLAKGKGLQFLIVEFSWFAAYYLSTRLLWPVMGLEGAGVAYVAAYLIYFPLVYLLVRPLCKFRYNKENILLMLSFTLYIVLSYFTTLYLKGWTYWFCGAMLFGLCGIKTVLELNKILPVGLWLFKIKNLFRK